MLVTLLDVVLDVPLDNLIHRHPPPFPPTASRSAFLPLLNARSHQQVPGTNGYSHAQATTGTGEGHYRQPADELGVRRRLCRRGRSTALGP